MNVISKVLVPNKEWILADKGQKFEFKSLKEIKEELGVGELAGKSEGTAKSDQNVIYGYPTSSSPYEPVYNVKKKLPLFAKSAKSKSQYCAGHYVIQFRKGWVKSFCPKLITLERYPFIGPFKTEVEMKAVLNSINKS